MTTFASLFTGFGLADIGAMQADLEPIWGVEIDPAIAEIAQSNLNHDIRVQSVLDCNPYHFEKPDVLWVSPPCTNFSVAKTDGKETELDRQLAIKIVDFLKVLKPQTFILENVELRSSFGVTEDWNKVESRGRRDRLVAVVLRGDRGLEPKCSTRFR